MLNYLILALLGTGVVLAPVSAIAEAVFRRNSKPYRFFRVIWLFLRELDSLRFGVTSVLLLFWGLASGDDNFYGIWMAIAMMLAILVVVHADDFFTFKKRRKKAAEKKNILGRTGLLPLSKETPIAGEAEVLVPMIAGNEQISSDPA
ncbi:MAG: hypothetical protein IKK47_01030 [Ruminococcus sp.]|nr:hypothetical protein [Ruminococcus sp.]